MLTQRDPYVNMLRATMATFAAGLGGANAITVLPHTLALGLPDALRAARRRATRSSCCWRNPTSPRCPIPRPAAGGIESLTRELCETAWSLFQEIEKAGGVFAALQQGLIQSKVAATRKAREANIARRRDVLTGASEFPNLNEAQVAVEDVKPAAAAPTNAADQLRAARGHRGLPRRSSSCATVRIRCSKAPASGRACSSPISARPPTSPRARPLPRASSRPAASRRSTARDSSDPAALAAAASRPPARPLVCLCSSDKVYAQHAIEAAKALTAAGARISIWQDGPASRRPRCATPASATSSLPAAMRLQCCNEAYALMERDMTDGRQACSDRRLPMRRRPLCAEGGARQGQHLPLPDVPEGLRRAVRLLCRYRARATSPGPRASRPRSDPPRSRCAISAPPAARRSASAASTARGSRS